jgi:ABC-type multidrug transport system fused ATPase/permease subunit
MIEGKMFFDYLKTFFLKIFIYSLACFLIFLFLGNKNLELLIVIGIIFVVIASFQTHQKLSEQTNIKLNETLRVKEEVQKEAYANRKEAELWKSSLLERNKGFSSLINAIQEYEKLKDESLSDHLSQKIQP